MSSGHNVKTSVRRKMGLPSERGRWGCFPSGAGCLPSSGSAQQSRPRLRWALWWPTNASWGTWDEDSEGHGANSASC